MAPLMNAQHVKLCRELYQQLLEIQFGHDGVASGRPLPFNLSILLAQLDRYIKWAARNEKIIEIVPRRPGLNGEEEGDAS